MGRRTAYAPGTFAWVDLATSDADGAIGFYGRLLGWEPHPTPMPGGDTYTMLNIGDDPVAALYELSAEWSQGAGQPPAWTSYVSVADVDATTARAQELGAKVISPPHDAGESGRMAVVADPQDAVFALWQASDFIGAGRVNDPGSLAMNQLNTSDPAAATDFYSALFGWTITQVATEPQPYWGIENGGQLNGGMMALPLGAGGPPHWLPYFTVADLDAAAATIAEAGGTVIVPATAIPAGRFLVARDPQGAYFALFEGEVDP